jgi:glycosyltransferase involved in cell wall biosynthesis
MRICMLNDTFYRGTGVAMAIQRIVESPPFANVDVYLASCGRMGGRLSNDENASFVASDHHRVFPLMESSSALIPGLLRFARWLREMRFNVLHVHHRRLAVLANAVRPFSGVPVLFTCHSTFAHSVWFRELAPDTATGVSPSVVAYLRRATKASNVSLIYNPVGFGPSIATDSRPPDNHAIAVGRLESGKGYEILIEAWSLLQRYGVGAKLDIFGEGTLSDTLARQIERSGLTHTVRLCGFAHNIPKRMCGYSFNILLSQKEGFPNAVVEAATQMIPTLLTNVDGCRDTLPPLLVLPNGIPFGNVYAVRDALIKWFGSPDLVREDGMRFYDFLKPRCSPAVVGEQYLTAYEGIADTVPRLAGSILSQ